MASAARPPSEERIEEVRKQFRDLRRPIEYESKVDRDDPRIPLHWIELRGQAKAFAETFSKEELIHGLWNYMDDPSYDAEATILLLGAVGWRHVEAWKLTYRSCSDPGNWAEVKKHFMEWCRIDCRRAIGEPPEWYPHKVLFDRETVLTASRTNAAARAAYIAAMQKALADPRIRTENPLEANSIILLLSALDAKEAANTFVNYMFYDWRRGGDYRMSSPDDLVRNIYRVNPPLLTCLPRLGKQSLPLVLGRLADATGEELSVQPGGGGAPVFAVQYFWLLNLTEAQAIKEIEDYKSARRDLTDKQVGSLDEIIDVIRMKKYRPSHVRGDWAAPSATNTVPRK